MGKGTAAMATPRVSEAPREGDGDEDDDLDRFIARRAKVEPILLARAEAALRER